MNFNRRYSVNALSYCRVGLFIIVYGLISQAITAQITPDRLKEYLVSNTNNWDSGIHFRDDVLDFYKYHSYQTAWIQQKDTSAFNSLLNSLSMAGWWGLRKKDYQYDFVAAFRNKKLRLQSQQDSLSADIFFTEAAIHFYSDIAYGNMIPSFGYSGIEYSPGCQNIPAILARAVMGNRLHSLALNLSPAIKEVNSILNKIRWIMDITEREDFKEVILRSGKADTANAPLLQKLFQLGMLDSVNKSVSETYIGDGIRKAQRMFNIPESGGLQQNLIRELNIPLQARLQQLNLSLNYYRWLSCLTQNQSVIVVNIPAAYLKVYKDLNVILEMKMVMGKPSTPTYAVTSIINEVIVYPYWHVPFSIATKELLPAIKRNPSYLDNNNYQVLDKAGKIIDPYSVNWQALSRNYFPYTIRQGTGCDNALGLLKLNFYNPFGAYLHDTPDKNLFQKQRRFYSHGCMRMEKPIDLGHLILPNNKISIDTLTEKGCLKSQAPVIVPAEIRMPVIVWYNPVGSDTAGNVIFYEDIYKKFNWGK